MPINPARLHPADAEGLARAIADAQTGGAIQFYKAVGGDLAGDLHMVVPGELLVPKMAGGGLFGDIWKHAKKGAKRLAPVVLNMGKQVGADALKAAFAAGGKAEGGPLDQLKAAAMGGLTGAKEGAMAAVKKRENLDALKKAALGRPALA